MKQYDLTEVQANYVAEMKLRNLNKTYITKQTKDLEELDKKIKTYKKIVNDDKSIDNMIVSTLEQINKKFAKPRMTKVKENK